MKIYDVSMDGVDGLTAISLVKNPAIKENFIYMSSYAKPSLQFSTDNWKHEIKGPVLIPDMLIYRSGDDKTPPYFIRWTKGTIYDVFLYVKKENKRKVTIDHSISLDNNEVVMKDFYISNGEDGYADGSLIARYKINDEALWERITNNDLVGFSIEANVNLILSK